MAWYGRAVGDVSGCNWVQVVPSHVHVSFSSWKFPKTSSNPPNSTTLPIAASYTIAESQRGDGEVAGACCAQLVPSQVQVSPRKPLVCGVPPKITVTCRAASYAIANSRRGSGETAGTRCVQLWPFHSQVSLRYPEGLAPPNSTVTPRAES